MNEREQFERQQSYHKEDFKPFCAGLKAGAESKQPELDKANARIAQLEEALRNLLRTKHDNHNCGDDKCSIETAWQVLPHPHVSATTWLSEHDKAVEVKVLEEFATKWLPNLKHKDMQSSVSQTNHNFAINDCIKHAYAMIESRKDKTT